MLKNILLASAVAMVGITGAKADIITVAAGSYSGSTCGDVNKPGCGRLSFNLAPFDTSLGTLESVNVAITGSAVGAVSGLFNPPNLIPPPDGTHFYLNTVISAGINVNNSVPTTLISYAGIWIGGASGEVVATVLYQPFNLDFSIGAGLFALPPGVTDYPPGYFRFDAQAGTFATNAPASLNEPTSLFQGGFPALEHFDSTYLMFGVSETFHYMPCMDRGQCKDNGQHIPEPPALLILAIGLLGLVGSGLRLAHFSQRSSLTRLEVRELAS